MQMKVTEYLLDNSLAHKNITCLSNKTSGGRNPRVGSKLSDAVKDPRAFHVSAPVLSMQVSIHRLTTS